MNLHDALLKADRQRQKAALTTEFDGATIAQQWLHERGQREEQAVQRLGLHRSLTQIQPDGWVRQQKLNKTFQGDVYHVKDVHQVCVQYRMRMLPSHHYHGPIDPEFGVKLKHFQEKYQLTATDLEEKFFIVAPAETFDLDRRQRPLIDPLLLYKIDEEHYRLVHQWGGDLHPLRYLRSWRHRNLTNMTLYWTVLTFLITMTLFGSLAESLTNALTIASVFTFLVGWGFYSTLRDNFEEQQHRFSVYNWNRDWTF